MCCRRSGFATRGRWAHEEAEEPAVAAANGDSVTSAHHRETHRDLGERYSDCEGSAGLLFTENETNNERLFGVANATPYVKDAFQRLRRAGKTTR